MKRNMVNKAPDIQCQWCKQMISSYNLTNHIKFKHRDIGPVEDYVLEFGEFRKNKEPKKNARKVGKVTCEICGKVCSTNGIHNHFRDHHDGLTPDQYVAAGYSEYRTKQKDYKERAKQTDIKCLICNREDFVSHRHFADHVRIEHRIPMNQYAFNYIFQGKNQYCKCGCGQLVELSNRPPYRNDFINTHASKAAFNGMTGKVHKKKSRKSMSAAAINRDYSEYKKQNTKPELHFVKFLQENGIEFRTQEPTEFGKVDFYLIDKDIFVEIDGDYWHPTTVEQLNMRLLSSCISQYRKRSMKNLLRIRASDLDKLSNFNDLINLNYEYNFDINYDQVILTKEYLTTRSVKEKTQLVTMLLTFLEYYQPTFPEIPTDETISEITKRISTHDFKSIKRNENEFRNNISNVGNSYLKSIFKSYWKSSFKKSKSPVEAWEDSEIMRKVIEYRIGLNESGEVFDFSLHQMVRGLSALRHTISFFKPLLAAAIYREFLGNNTNPVVLDPCAGFGGRMLGFKSLYPHGTYIGIEPNIETYNELQKLAIDFKDVVLYNCKIEDLDLSILPEIDLTFTSIPYYNLETYSQPVEYKSFDQWNVEFLGRIRILPNTVLNIPVELRNEFDLECNEYRIISNTSHFNKNKNEKFEYLLKFY